MRVLLLASGYNGLTQRVHRELLVENHTVQLTLDCSQPALERTTSQFQPHLIICPFLKEPVPEAIWQRYTTLIVHPGIRGDRGPSALDWAIMEGWSYWGVTLVEAAREMDAGDIWGSREFPTRLASKVSHYRREVTDAAMSLIHAAIEDSVDPEFRPRPLNYDDPDIKGSLRPLMKQQDRRIDWANDSAVTIKRKIAAGDSFPGLLDRVDGHEVFLYGGVIDTTMDHGEAPGTFLGTRDGAVCRATYDGAIWIRQMKRRAMKGTRFFKLPAQQVMAEQLRPNQPNAGLPHITTSDWREIQTEVDSGVGYLTFDFYNGAMSTDQCRRLRRAYRELAARKDIGVIVIYGGRDFWSNGIHLNCIEAAPDPARESWYNINAIDDVIHDIIETRDKVTVAAMRNGAGAGGAMMAAACDYVVARRGVVLNPHYRTVGLFGSEYWTYTLPQRVGRNTALYLMEACPPVLAQEARDMGLVDQVFSEDWTTYHEEVTHFCRRWAADGAALTRFLDTKRDRRERDEAWKPLSEYRADELQRMAAIFYDPGAPYHALRKAFVYKQPQPDIELDDRLDPGPLLTEQASLAA